MKTLDRLILEALYWKPYQTAQELALRLERSPHRVTGRLRWMERKRMICTGALVNQLFTWRLSARMERRQIAREIAEHYEEAVGVLCMERTGIGRKRAT